MKRMVAAGLIAATLAGCGSGTSGSNQSAGSHSPGFDLVGLDGARHHLSAYRGKVVLINFWATWCIPCRAEMPDLEHEYRIHKAAGFVVLGINWREASADAAAFAHELDITYPVLLDADGKVHDAYQVSAMPTSFMVDRSGHAGPARVGILARDEQERQINEALAR